MATTNRLDRIRAAMAEAALDGLYISCPVDDVFHRHSQNREYASGFSGSTGQVLITPECAFIAVDFRYVEQAERECAPRGFAVHRVTGRDPGRWFPALAGDARIAGKRIGVSRADLNYGDWVLLAAAVEEMPASDRPTLVPAPPLVEDLRARKDPEEMRLLQRAIDVGDRAFERVATAVRPGQTEAEVAIAVERAVRDLGGDGLSFETIVAGGPWGAMPHASPRPEPIAAGAPLVIDMGALCGGYCSDLTRTIVLGDRDSRFDEIYAIVFEAQRAAIEGVETGMSGADAHNLAAAVIASHGYGDQFGHGLGHGVGREVHESPALGTTSTDTLEEGMVFTIEPGIYIPRWGGVRIEDVVTLENGRARLLSRAAKVTPAGVKA